MARINLLPWREAARKRRQQEFIILAALGLVAAAGLALFVHLYMEGLIEYQNQRNVLLETEINQIKIKLQEIQELEKTKASLIARMNVIQQLQSSRPEIVHLFDELVNTLPDGAYLTKVDQKEANIAIDGRAQSNARVSAYMRNIDASVWMGGATLKVIEQKDAKGSGGFSQFSLVAKQMNKSKPPEPDGGVGQKHKSKNTK